MSNTQSPDRLILFTDAVVAIAVTLLILPLVEVVAESAAHDKDAVHVVTDHKAQIFTFLLSFVVIAGFWLGHHRVFSHVRGYTAPMMLVNLVWLLAIVFLPFPTQIVGAYDSSQFTAGLYTATILVLSICQTLLTRMIRGHETLEDPADPITGRELQHSYLMTGLTLLAFLLAAFVPGVTFYALFLLTLSPLLMRVMDRVRPAQNEQ